MSHGLAIAAVRARLLQDRSLQFDYAVLTVPPVQKPPKWLVDLGAFIGHAISAVLPVLRVLFWIGVGAAILAVVFLIVREVLGVRFSRTRKASPRVSPADWRPDMRKARALLADADRLAEAGRYDEAARLILTRGIEDIDDRRPRLVRPGLTARDIAALNDVPAPARRAFSEIAGAVEASWFGGRPLGAAAFAQCRHAYETFALADGWA